MIRDAVSRLWRPGRVACPEVETPEEVSAFIDSRALEYPSRLEDEFAERAGKLGVESGMILDVGTRVGLTLLKVLWKNENFFAIGLDRSGPMIERARETATAWELGERAFFQVGDARRMRFKTEYFDLVISDTILHRFDNVEDVLGEIRRVLKPKGALLIRDFRRPNRLQMAAQIGEAASRYSSAMQLQVADAIRASYTRAELERAIRLSGLSGTGISEPDRDHILVERRGETDPNSWVTAREQYR